MQIFVDSFYRIYRPFLQHTCVPIIKSYTSRTVTATVVILHCVHKKNKDREFLA